MRVTGGSNPSSSAELTQDPLVTSGFSYFMNVKDGWAFKILDC